MPINHSKKIIFIHIPKTGGTSISNGLFDGEPTHNSKILLGSMIRIGEVCRRSSHCTIKEINQIYPNIVQTYDKITVVRNPFDRILSEYFHLIRYKIVHPVLGKIEELEFSDFVREVYYNFDTLRKNQNFRHEDYFIHFLPQNDFLKLNGNILDDIRIYRFEQFKKIEKDFNLTQKKNVNTLKSGKRYHSFYDLKSMKMVEEIYLEDLQTFNYCFGE